MIGNALKIGLRVPAACGTLSRVPTNREVEHPRRSETNGTRKQKISVPRKRSTASRSMFYPFAGSGFCKWK